MVGLWLQRLQGSPHRMPFKFHASMPHCIVNTSPVHRCRPGSPLANTSSREQVFWCCWKISSGSTLVCRGAGTARCTKRSEGGQRRTAGVNPAAQAWCGSACAHAGVPAPGSPTCAMSCARRRSPRAHSGTGFLGWSSSSESWSLLKHMRKAKTNGLSGFTGDSAGWNHRAEKAAGHRAARVTGPGNAKEHDSEAEQKPTCRERFHRCGAQQMAPC